MRTPPQFPGSASTRSSGPVVMLTFRYLAKKEVRDAAGAAALEDVSYVELDSSLPTLKRLLGEDEAPPGLAVASYVSILLLVQAVRETPRPIDAAELMAAL